MSNYFSTSRCYRPPFFVFFSIGSTHNSGLPFSFIYLCDLHWSLVSAVGTVLIVAVNVAFLHLEFNYGDIDALSQHFVVLFSVPHKPLYEE